MCLYDFDIAIINEGLRIFAGIDEVGRGPLAGPVVAAAVILNYDIKIDGLNDSKKLTAQEREKIFYLIRDTALSIGIGIIDANKIDRLNIIKATRLAMSIAAGKLRLKPDLLLIDGMNVPSIGISQRAIIKGDAKSASIAAASVIAKVTRDRIMIKYHKKYPLYGFDRHKGYPTTEHIEKLYIHGPCPIHRMSFQRVNSFVLPFD